MVVGLVQYSPLWEDVKGNMQKIKSMLAETEGTDLLVFPEMTLTGFTMNSILFAEALDGETVTFFKEIAKDKNTNVFAGIIEKETGSYFNTLLHINKKGELVNLYRKVHPFSFSAEDKHYSRGNKVVTTEVEGWKAGLSICYDLRFPELYRYYGKDRASLVVNIANWPDTRIEHWRTLLKARAIENQCYVIGVNRVGNDPKLYYSGYSSVFGPMGEELVSLKDEEKIIVVDLTLDKAEEVRAKLPFLNDIYLLN